MAGVEIFGTISKEAWNLIKTGKATLEKGGVKVDGKFIELIKPTLQKTAGKALESAAGNILGGLNLVSSVGCNVQCAFIQKGVNQANLGIDKANQKLDIVIDTLGDISSAVGKLGQIQAVSWLNCAIGIANIGVSVAGFYYTSKKLDKLDLHIEEVNTNILRVEEQLKTKEKNEKIRRFKSYINNMKADIDELKNLDFNISDLRNIRNMLNDIAVFLEDLISEFGNEPELNELYCHMIFSLSELFLQEINIYTAKYYYASGNYPSNYGSWINVFISLNSDEFLRRLKRYIDFGNPRIPLKTRKDIYNYSMSLFKNQAFQLDYNYNLIGQLSFEEYMDIDTYMINRIKQIEQPIMLENGMVAF